jgi:xanthine phosphoribosyltransferase
LALMAALELDVPLVFARKKKSILMVDDVYHSVVYSYTKEENYDITISKKFLPAGEKVLIIDDFLASGEAAMGLAKLVEDAGDEVVGMAIAIEKSFQPGRERLEHAGYRVESLVRIKEFKDNGCVFIED